MNINIRVKSLLVAASVVALLQARSSLAQTTGGTGAGLDHLDESKVMNELSSLSLTDLLDRDFDAFKVPPEQRAQAMTYVKLAGLSNPNKKPEDRRADALLVANGLKTLLPKMQDPQQLLERANTMFFSGVMPTVNEMEYFGENPVSRGQLRPAAEITQQMYQQAAKLFHDKIDAVANKQGMANDKIMAQIRLIRPSYELCNYRAKILAYPLAMGTDPKNPDRAKIADDGINYLKPFDVPRSNAQPQIELQLGKLMLTKGDFEGAKAMFENVANNPGNKLKPAPERSQTNQGKYFAIVAQIMSGDFKSADAAIPSLEKWQSIDYLGTLAPGDQDLVTATVSMLRFRLYSAESDFTNDAGEKTKFNNQAIDTLSDLLGKQPGLKGFIYDQLLERIPEQADYASMNPLVLRALMEQGVDELIKKPDQPMDKAKVHKAIPAAQELVNRRGNGVDDKLAAQAAVFIGYADEKLDDKKGAANAFMDVAEKFPKESSLASESMGQAEALLKDLRDASHDDPDTVKIYNRYLPLAINPPFNDLRFAFSYARVLQADSQFKKAVEYYQKVPSTDPSYQDTQFFELVALSQELKDPNSNLTGDDRKKIATQVVDLDTAINGIWRAAKTDADRTKWLNWMVSADQIAADMARVELKDYQKSLQVLDGFEAKIKGAKGESDADSDAMRLRINDYMGSAQVEKATETLLNLLKSDPASGQALMGDVLQGVVKDKNAALEAGKMDDVKKLSQDQAQLSGFVLDWALKTPDVAKQIPDYRRFNADSVREAAEYNDDPAARKQQLEAALKQYQALIGSDPDNIALQQGIGLTYFSLGNFADALKYLAPVAKRLLPTEEVKTGEVTQVQENTDYWEANYKLFKSALELAKASPKDKAAIDLAQNAHRQVLSQFIQNHDKVGGSKYHDDYVKLREDMAAALPPLTVAKPAAPSPAAPAAAPK